MLNIFTVSFFGHRSIERVSEIENRLDKLLHDIITQKEYVEFLIGRDGEFDLLASAAIKRTVREYGYGNTHFTLVLPYMKAAIQIRNRNLVDRSDLIVCCIQRKSGGAYKTMQYAEKRGKCIINLADN